MNYEKKYKKSLERAKKLYKDAITPQLEQDIKDYEYIFPELKESEDDRIRKELIDYINRLTVSPNNIDRYNSWIAWLEKQKSVGEIVERCKNSWYNEGKIAGMLEGLTDDEKYQQGWHDALEKQGKQKVSVDDFKAKNWYVSEVDGKIHDMTYNPTDKDEPKFKVGDWIISKYMHLVMQILNNDNGSYKTLETDGTERNDSYDFIERNFKLWTIDDAKDGDVLATENFIFIFKNIDDGNGVHYYCQYEISKHEDDNQFDIALPQSLMGRVGNSIIHYSSATKEQRDLLFQKMKEDGYEWDAEKKELKKIEQPKLTVIKDMMDDYRDDIDKHAWSVEDSSKVQRICQYLDEAKKYYADITEVRECVEWLKSLEDRVQPKPTEWSEDDEENLQHCCDAIGAADYYTYDDKQEMEKWLLQLKERLS